MIGHTDKQTSFGTGIEQQGIGFVRYTLERHLVTHQSGAELRLASRFALRCSSSTCVKPLSARILKSRYEAYRIAMGRRRNAVYGCH